MEKNIGLGISPNCTDIRIEPMAAAHIESLHRTLDLVAREKKYLTLLEARPCRRRAIL